MIPGERTYLEYIYGLSSLEYKLSSPQILLTFDDGPFQPVTGEILKVLHQFHVTAVFFILTGRVNDWNFVKEMQNRGHGIGLHGLNHLPVNMANGWEKEWDLSLKKMRDHDINPVALRPPYGLYGKRFLTFAQKTQLPVLMWNHTTYDYKSTDGIHWAEKVASQVKPGDILLMHDSQMTEQFHPAALRELLHRLKDLKISCASLNYGDSL